MKLLALALASLTASATALIVGWKPVDGLTEAEADLLARRAIHNFLAYDDDGQVCGVDEVWNLERETDVIADRPERGEIFAVTAYAKGPDMQCTVTRTFDCRVVFNRPPTSKTWAVEYADCEPPDTGADD